LEKGVPFLRVTDLTNSNDSKKFISKEQHEELIRHCKPENGDILYTKNGTIGIAKIVDWNYEFSIFVSLCLLKPKKDLLLPKYLEVFLNTPFALQQAISHSKKGTITNLHLNQIQKIRLPVPSIKEQQTFIERIENVENLQNKQAESEHRISFLFDSLMQKAFNGELVS
jgi:restriction endonuclease S subunit